MFLFETRWAREPKSKTAHSVPFLKELWCGQLCSARNQYNIFLETSCALMASGATIHHSVLRQLCLHSSSRYFCSCNDLYPIFLAAIFFLGSRLVCFAAGGARTKRRRTEHCAKWKLNDGGTWPKEHENEDMKMTDGEWSWKMRHDERWVKTSLHKSFYAQNLVCVCKRVSA